MDPTALDALDENDASPLHVFLKMQIKLLDHHVFAHFSEILEILITKNNINMQDRFGCTPLHYLCNILNAKVLRYDLPDDFCKGFLDLINRMKSPLNGHLQDENGQTALHILSSKLFMNPNLGKLILPVIDALAEVSCPNVTDTHAVTPYTWMYMENQFIAANELNHNCPRDAEVKMFAKTEETLAKNGADIKKAKAGITSAL